MTLLINKDILNHEEGLFYGAEMVLAIEAVHKMNYIHRDLKPDNILMDKNGHLKLTDFGLCKYAEINPVATNQSTNSSQKMSESGSQAAFSQNFNNLKAILDKKLGYKRQRRALAFSAVGTPDYIAPEVIWQKGYDETVDWWSFGVIMFEMLVGYPPFYSDQPSQTWQKILHWKEHFVIPPEAKISQEAKDLIHGLVSDSETRLGRNGAEEVKKHPFFKGIDWDNMRSVEAPNIPQVSSEVSAENFDKFDEDKLAMEERKYHKRHPGQGNKRIDIDFIGYTYKGDVEQERLMLVNVLKELDTIDSSLCTPPS